MNTAAASGTTIFDNKNVKIILGIAGVISLILLIRKFWGDSEEEKRKKKAGKSRNQSYIAIPPSYPDYEYEDAANVLEQSLANMLTEDEDAVYAIFNEVKNISDVNKIIEFYGERRAYTLGKRTLPQTIASLFSVSEKAKLNGILKKKGIAYTFK